MEASIRLWGVLLTRVLCRGLSIVKTSAAVINSCILFSSKAIGVYCLLCWRISVYNAAEANTMLLNENQATRLETD